MAERPSSRAALTRYLAAATGEAARLTAAPSERRSSQRRGPRGVTGTSPGRPNSTWSMAMTIRAGNRPALASASIMARDWRSDCPGTAKLKPSSPARSAADTGRMRLLPNNPNANGRSRSNATASLASAISSAAVWSRPSPACAVAKIWAETGQPRTSMAPARNDATTTEKAMAKARSAASMRISQTPVPPIFPPLGHRAPCITHTGATVKRGVAVRETGNRQVVRLFSR